MYDSKYWVRENRKVRRPKVIKDIPELRIADLFCGCGGMTLGAQIACKTVGRRLKVAVAADVWTDALTVYNKNFGDHVANSVAADLSTMVTRPGSTTLSNKGKQLASGAGELDVVLAGPPCQGHSDLNNSSRRDDPRNLLYTIPVAFALHAHAKILILENVPSVIHSSDGVVNAAWAELEENGYSVAGFLADAQDFGLPQTRKRHFLVASRIHAKDEMETLLSSVKRRTKDVPLWPFIEDIELEPEDERLITKRSLISADNKNRIKHLFDTNSFDLPNSLRPPCHRDKEHSYVSMYGRLRADRPAQTITSGFGSMGQGRFVHPTQPRMITAHEAARIQGFPDYFDFGTIKKITALREMIGNAVPPAISAVLLALFMPALAVRNSNVEASLAYAA